MGKTTETSAPKKKRSAEKIYCEHQTFATKEAFKKLRTNILNSLEDNKDKGIIVGITSAQPSEGKSTVAINLAYSFAELGKKVMLIDCDMRRPSLHFKLEKDQSPGLSELLSHSSDLKGIVQEYISDDEKYHFGIISAGEIPDNPSELLNDKRMKNLIAAINNTCDVLILDFPPVDAVTDAVSAGKYTDGMLVVVHENRCPSKLLEDCVDQLKYANINILGFVLNGSREGTGKKYNYNYGYGYR